MNVRVSGIIHFIKWTLCTRRKACDQNTKWSQAASCWSKSGVSFPEDYHHILMIAQRIEEGFCRVMHKWYLNYTGECRAQVVNVHSWLKTSTLLYNSTTVTMVTKAKHLSLSVVWLCVVDSIAGPMLFLPSHYCVPSSVINFVQMYLYLYIQGGQNRNIQIEGGTSTTVRIETFWVGGVANM